MVIIPKSIQKELQEIKTGKPAKKREKEQPSPQEWHQKAVKNLTFLNEVAETEPIYSFLKGGGKILVLNEFDTVLAANQYGGLWLETINGTTGLFYWLDALYPADRSESDHTLVTESYLKQWRFGSAMQFAAMTKKGIWKNIKRWLQNWRQA